MGFQHPRSECSSDTPDRRSFETYIAVVVDGRTDGSACEQSTISDVELDDDDHHHHPEQVRRRTLRAALIFPQLIAVEVWKDSCDIQEMIIDQSRSVMI